MSTVRIFTFGTLHAWVDANMPEGITVADVPEEDFRFNLNRILRDPAHVPSGDMLDLTGEHDDVRAFVRATEGYHALLDNMFSLVRDVAQRGKDVVVYVTCAGGRHRSVAAALDLADALWLWDIDAEVTHLTKHLDRVVKK